jgi:hypothetical protein
MFSSQSGQCACRMLAALLIGQWLWLPAACSDNGEADPVMKRLLCERQRGYQSELAAAGSRLKQNPADLSCLNDYLQAYAEAVSFNDRLKSLRGPDLQKPSLSGPDWLVQIFQPKTAFEALSAADKIAASSPYVPGKRKSDSMTAALKMLAKSLNMKFTDEDRKQVDRCMASLITHSSSPLRFIHDAAGYPSLTPKLAQEQLLRYWTRLEMMECAHVLKDRQQESKLLLELAETTHSQSVYFARRAHSLGQEFMPDGSPLPRILKGHEDRQASNSEYWLDSACSYGFLNDDQNTRQSYLKALEATDNDNPAYFFCKGGCRRYRALHAYVDYLVETGKQSEAVELLKKEIAKHPDKQVLALQAELTTPGKSHLSGSFWRWTLNKHL